MVPEILLLLSVSEGNEWKRSEKLLNETESIDYLIFNINRFFIQLLVEWKKKKL
jgi:hypothetical protein